MRAILFVLVAGCNGGGNGDACPRFTSRCQDNSVEVCISFRQMMDRDFFWDRQRTCGAACIQATDGDAHCVDSPQPIPECSGRRQACWNGNRTLCIDGYPADTTACRPDGCVLIPGDEAICSASMQPVIECATEGESICWNGLRSRCYHGYPSDPEACSFGETCVDTGCNQALCALSPSPNPRCPPPDP